MGVFARAADAVLEAVAAELGNRCGILIKLHAGTCSHGCLSAGLQCVFGSSGFAGSAAGLGVCGRFGGSWQVWGSLTDLLQRWGQLVSLTAGDRLGDRTADTAL